mgnify:CR=1 FL=1
MTGPPLPLRRLMLQGTVSLAWVSGTRHVLAQVPPGSDTVSPARWYDAAEALRQQALSWGDQPHGAVLVLEGALVGEGPSRVVLRADPTAHAEREAIRDAQRRLGRTRLTGAVLYSTSRPCRDCERAAAAADVARMVHGADLRDAGRPQRDPG